MIPEDKELTERAALASGILVEWQEAHHCFWISPGQGIANHRAWAPLDNDGQTLRLANRLRISIAMYDEGVTTRHFSRVTRTLGSEIGREDAATRRAIVTAAAAMWLDHVDEMDKGEISPAAIVGGGWSALKMVATMGDGRLSDVPQEAGGLMLKVQTYDARLGWVHATRAGEFPTAWGVLASYRKRWPSESHRLVSVANDGTVTVIPDDTNMLSLFGDEEGDSPPAAGVSAQ